jgi:hypothetical protein
MKFRPTDRTPATLGIRPEQKTTEPLPPLEIPFAGQGARVISSPLTRMELRCGYEQGFLLRQPSSYGSTLCAVATPMRSADPRDAAPAQRGPPTPPRWPPRGDPGQRGPMTPALFRGWPPRPQTAQMTPDPPGDCADYQPPRVAGQHSRPLRAAGNRNQRGSRDLAPFTASLIPVRRRGARRAQVDDELR